MANIKIIATNKKAHFDYEILENFEAGIELTGPEVKSIRDGHVSLKEAFATVKDNQIWLNNAHINNYKPAAQNNTEPTRSRRLLLHKKEIAHLVGKVQISGFTLVPLKMYFTHGIVKIDLGLGRGKKQRDKREVIKNRELERDIAREISDKQ